MARRFKLLVARLIAMLVFHGPTKIAGGRLLFDPATGRIMPTVAGGSPEGDDEKDEKDDADKADDGKADDEKDEKDDDSDEDDDSGADKGKQEPDWKRMARKHEREAKKARKERDEAAAKLKERDDANKSEQDKALEQARKDGETAAESKYAEQRRDDKIENTVTKLALKGFKVGEGDEKKTLKFADPDDAQLRLERAIRRGELSYDDIYSDGKVKTDAVSEFLGELLDENPHLRAGETSSSGGRKVEGGADGGKGSKGAASDEDKSVDDHFKQIRRTKAPA